MACSRLTTKWPQIGDSPIIIGDRYELAEAVGLSYGAQLDGGLLAHPEPNRALLPMSHYGKAPDADLSVFNAKKTSSNFINSDTYSSRGDPKEPSYRQYVVLGESDTQLQLSTIAYDRLMDHMGLSTASNYHDSTPYETPERSYDDFTPHDAQDSSLYAVRAIKTKHKPSGHVEASSSLKPSSDLIRKRKLSFDSPHESSATKRISPTHPPLTDQQNHSPYSYTDSSLTYPQDLQPAGGSTQQIFSSYQGSQDRHVDQNGTPALGTYSMRSNTTDLPHPMASPFAQNLSHSPSFAANRSSDTPDVSSNASFQVSSSSSPNPVNPPLVRVRASNLQQLPGSVSDSAASSSDSLFNPYGVYTKRAVIHICGDLNVMRDEWTPEEKLAKRRLVCFRGEQRGSTINTYFQAVKPDERPSSSQAREKRISCIYWEERDEYFVTSVDTIALLETLVGARFQVDEKNRIRRNLETHHPETICKGKAETESFFKVIMGFPSPKPRNIEKDVKVFRWHDLAQALGKVIGKYCPSPASIANPLATARNLRITDAYSGSGSARCTQLSSRSSPTSSAYNTTLKSSLLSPSNTLHPVPPQYSTVSPRTAPVTSLPHSYTFPPLSSHYSYEDGRHMEGSNYLTQPSASDLPPAYLSAATGRRRSSDANIYSFGANNYPARPRANISSSSLCETAQQPAGYPSDQLPGNPQDYAFLRSQPGSFHNDYQGRLLTRQGSQLSQ